MIDSRLIVKDGAQAERLQSMGIRDHRKVYTTEELAPGKEIIFAATGVTECSLLKGVRFFGDGVRVNSLVLTLATRSARFIDSIHVSKRASVEVRFQAEVAFHDPGMVWHTLTIIVDYGTLS